MATKKVAACNTNNIFQHVYTDDMEVEHERSDDGESETDKAEVLVSERGDRGEGGYRGLGRGRGGADPRGGGGRDRARGRGMAEVAMGA